MMEIKANIPELKKTLDDVTVKMKKWRNDDKRKAAFVAVYIGLVSAITTVCIGIVTFLPESSRSVFGIISLVSSASLTVVAAWDGIFHHKKLWINEARTMNELYELEADIRHAEKSSSGITQKQANDLYIRYKKIMSAWNERWYKIRE
jgi:hypothetical protein